MKIPVLLMASLILAGLTTAQNIEKDDLNGEKINQTELEGQLEILFNNGEKYEDNLTKINEGIQEKVPGSVRSVVLGSDVNVRVGDATLGVKTNKTGVTGFESEGLENPDMNITTDQETIMKIANSDNTVEEFREAFHGEGIKVETNSVKTTVLVGVANIISKGYGIIQGII